MIGMLAGLVGRLSGPVLIYILLGLIASNALTGYLLKSAWEKNATAVLECENQALRDANDHNVVIVAELERIRIELAIEKQVRLDNTRAAEKEIASLIRAKEIEHEEQLIALEAATNEIDDEDFFCASEPVAPVQLVGMRDAIAAYNRTRNNPSTATNAD
jgi:hypothetical protein